MARPALARRSEPLALGILLLLTVCAWVLAVLGGTVLEGRAFAFDEALLLALREPGALDDPIGGRWLEEIARDVTALGGFALLTLVTVAVSGHLWLSGKWRSMVFLVAAVVGGALVSTAAKALFDRPRPELVPHEVLVTSASFPSGHTMLAAVTYLTLAALMARVETRRRIRLYLLTVALVVTVAVGASRVYLGVHWPTDVIGGWAAGTLWALLAWLVARRLGLAGRIDPEPPER
ncbi:phosphatase PAP2 family protein [Acuticoccus sp.]|uniref:phosphatase PAP2 family protein n=1 Tax=Acuticoccus sp. TaxID=1904378 RepID=UPI003B51D51F